MELHESCSENISKQSSVCDSSSEKHDPYFYIKRSEFTSEIYKIEVGNLPSYVRYEQLRKFLGSKLKLNPCKIKGIGKPPHIAFVTFRCEEDRDNALKVLQGFTWKGRDLYVKKANPLADPLVKKRKAGDSEDSVAAKKSKNNLPVNIRLKNAVTPLWSLPYSEQLKQKEELMHQFLIKLGRQVEKINKSPPLELLKQRKENSFMCCPLLPIKPSPVETEYRNKCEFSVGLHLETGERTVGFRLSRYKDGSMSVAEPDDCTHIPSTMLQAVKAFQDYVRESDKDVFNPETYKGYWRQLTVRTTQQGDIMLIVVMHPQELNEDQLEKEKNCLKEYFSKGKGYNCMITSMYFQAFSKKRPEVMEPTLEHIFGKKFVEETLLQMRFCVSPEAFFQVNTQGADVLYNTIKEIANIKESSTLLDICCGTGTIGLIMAKNVGRVIGIESCPQAVQDARLNAEINGITNAEFLNGKAQDIIYDVIQKCKSSDTVAIVDPPRAGLHNKVVKAIRANEDLKQLVYVSCNPNAAITNFTDLCRPTSNSYRGNPFYPVKAVPVDLFPQTPHCELILVFERIN